MLRACLLFCFLSCVCLVEAMSSHEAARLANTAYLNHRAALIEQLGSADLEERQRAMRMLADLQDPIAIPHLLPFMDELANRPEDIISAMRALAELHAERAVSAFSAHTRHPDERVSKAAYNALARIDALDGEHHIDLTGEAQAGLRATGVIGLALSDADRLLAGGILAATLSDDEDAHIRRMAAIGLGDLGDPIFAQHLIDALADPNPGVRRRAAESLVRLDHKPAIPYLLIAMDANFAGAHLNHALKVLSGEDFGFETTAPAATRRIAIDKAFRWYTANAHRLQ